MRKTAQEVLAEILPGTIHKGRHHQRLWPSYDDLLEFAELLGTSPAERQIHPFLQRKPQFLLGTFGHGDATDLAFLSKPKIGSFFEADFAVLNYDQGGCQITLIEIEGAADVLFTRRNTPAKRLQAAMGQVDDWCEWMKSNAPTFIRETIARAKRLPPFPAGLGGPGLRLVPADHLEQSWQAFGGYTDPILRYAIVIGRWSSLSERHRQRLLYLNGQLGFERTMRTYDDLIRRSIARPYVGYEDV